MISEISTVQLTEKLKNNVLQGLASLIDSHRESILLANQNDLDNCQDLDESLIDRLKVTDKKIDAMIASLHEVCSIPDPVGQLLYEYDHPNGMKVKNKSVPFGKIMIIYESRPDVTIEAAASAFKAGNKTLLKGGKESKHSNLLLVDLWHQALSKEGISTDYVEYLDLDRSKTQDLIKNNTKDVDLIIPRGGDGLINFVKNNSSVPVLVSGRGNNFVYVSEDADAEMAIDIICNGKSRLSVCNAIDKVLINGNMPNLPTFCTDLIHALNKMEIKVDGDQSLIGLGMDVSLVPGEETWYEEFLSARILLGITNSSDEAIQDINKYSGGHSAIIVTKDDLAAEEFMTQVDCAAVYHNASSRFTDGGQFGFGAEMAISTEKLHFRGPLGLGQLVTNKWFIKGEGQTR